MRLSSIQRNLLLLAQTGRIPSHVPEFIARGARSMIQATQSNYRRRKYHSAVAGEFANMHDAADFLAGHPSTLDCPLVVISQAQRSGGSLLSQLFDGHPKVAAHPDELRLDNADLWPDLDITLGAEQTFQSLFDPRFPRMVARGYSKDGNDPNRHSFLLIPHIQHKIFRSLWEASPPATQRAVLDHYFTAYFNAWINYQGDLVEKQFISAFAPRLADDEASVERLFRDYPDGKLIQIVRDPRSWYPSAKQHKTFELPSTSMDDVLGVWQHSARSILQNRQKYGDCIIVLRFEELVGSPEQTMRGLTRLLGIAYDPILSRPTFNGKLMKANSSFAVETSGIIKGPLNRSKTLSDAERDHIERTCVGLYEEVSRLAVDTPDRPLQH